MRALISIAAICLLGSLIACSGGSLEPKVRPSKVPSSAVWAGGADGGAYVHCSVDIKRNVDVCEIWDDYTGQSTGPADYQLEHEHRAATEAELKFLGAASPYIFLTNGRVLKAL